MNLVKASYEILDRRKLSIPQKIEQCGRLAYKSEDKITETSAPEFLQKIMNHKPPHFPVVEFANIHIYVKANTDENTANRSLGKLLADTFPMKYLQITSSSYLEFVLSGTIRAFMDVFASRDVEKQSLVHLIIHTAHQEYLAGNFPFAMDIIPYEFDGSYECKFIAAGEVRTILPLNYKEHLMCAVHFVTNRAVTHELVRHRPCSFIQESQRYCRYNQNRFGNEVTFIIPSAFNDKEKGFTKDMYKLWQKSMRRAEEDYLQLLSGGASPQAARTVLPNSCKTEIIVYCTITEWEYIFNLRTSLEAEPSMRELMVPLSEEFFSLENQFLWE